MKFFCFLFIGSLLCSCEPNPGSSEGKVLARVDDHYLYVKDIKGIVHEGVSKEDSVQIVNSYINSWIKEELILHKAKINLTEEQQNFDDQLQDYKNSLLIYAFEEKLIEQKLDTNISQTDIEIYYSKNKGNFELKENIIQFKYMKVPLNAPNIEKIESWLDAGNESELERLNDYCTQFAEKCSFDTSRWVAFETLLNEIPIEVGNPIEFLENQQSVIVNDSLFKYILVILDHRIKSTVSPKNFVEQKIRTMILRQRRLALLSEIKKEIFEEGTINHRYEVYISEKE